MPQFGLKWTVLYPILKCISSYFLLIWEIVTEANLGNLPRQTEAYSLR
jgi:hypothetical protein